MRIFILYTTNAGPDFFKFKYRIPTTREERAVKRGPVVGTAQLDWSGYADDIVLYLLSLDSLQTSLALINAVFKRFKLTINVKKTESMTTNHKFTYREQLYPENVIVLNDQPIANTDKFPYLGSQIVYDQTTGDWEINYRIESAKNKFSSMKNLLLNHEIYLQTRIVFLRAYIRCRLIFNYQSWVLTLAQSNKFDATWRTSLRKIIRGFNVKTMAMVKTTNSTKTTNTLLKQVLVNLAMDKQTFVNNAKARLF